MIGTCSSQQFGTARVGYAAYLCPCYNMNAAKPFELTLRHF
jgi:hypothetical protein